MSKGKFSSSDNYQGLQEAIEAIMREDGSDVEVDLVALPPEPSVLTDEEEGDDDKIMTNDFPKDIPGNVEVFINRNDDEWDSSDEELLATTAAKKRRTDNLPGPRWRKCHPTYDSIIFDENNVQERREKMVSDLKDLNPVAIFEKMFDNEIISMIIQNSKLYSAQKNKHDFDITEEQLKTFLGILLLTGYHTLPRERLYWSLDEDCNVPIVSKAMTRNRFLEIKKFLHFCDNEVAAETSDKMFKIRPLGDILMKKYMQWGIFHTNLSIDESMIKYFGRHPSKQFIRGKPVRFGYKNWMVSSADGYCYAFDIYCGKSPSTNIVNNEPLGSRVVKTLLNKLGADPKDHIVFFDNFFTSFGLLRELRETGYRATGTVREGRTGKCPLIPIKEMKKKNRAEYDYRFDTTNKILFVRWLDNSVCTMGTNYDSVLPLGKVKRWSSAEKKKTDVDIPQVFVSYNKGMGGVDQADQSISLYRTSIRGKKWWWVLFTYMLDLTVSNCWRLHTLCNDVKMDQLQFRRSIARHYLRQETDRRSRPTASIVPSLQFDGIGHFPQKLNKQLRCTVCHNKARWQCKKCIKTLCIEKLCFETFHTE
ncbi:piggyBac transposable element-derived protein 3-like [Amyelois transitella]|uniref:piggyBac transposable element-derived protein 3-like n=1 Tax=Amyelois transitella TaxID=680683 RepID=UPI0029900619|nr:piggyBac transposable element-derived protein 3-like [Amyelois transitella]